MPLDSKQLKPFFAKFGRFVALTTHSGDWISRFGNFSVHDDNRTTTTESIALPLAHAHGIIIVRERMGLANYTFWVQFLLTTNDVNQCMSGTTYVVCSVVCGTCITDYRMPCKLCCKVHAE